MGWVEQQSSSRSSIGPNWSRQPLGGVKKAEVKYPGHTSPPLSYMRSWILHFSWISLSLSGKMHSLENAIYWLSLQLWTTPSQLRPWWEEKPPSLFTSLLFFDFSLFSFRWARVLSYVCQRRQAQDSAKPANAHFNDPWTLSQSATSEKPFPAKTEDKGKSLNTKATQVQTPDFAELV